MFQQPQQSPYQASGIGIAISGMIPQVVQAICQQNSLDANVYNQLTATMQQSINQITQQIETRYDISNGLHTDVLYQELAAIAASILNESNVSKPLFQQPQNTGFIQPNVGQPVGFGGPNMMGAQGGFQQVQQVQFGNTGGFTPAGIGGNPNPINSATSFTGDSTVPERTIEEPSAPIEPKVEEHIYQPVDSKMYRRTDSLKQYELIAVPNIGRYNKTFVCGDLITVSSLEKAMCTETGEVFQLSHVHNAIKEPSLQRLITNTVDPNPLIFKNKWISVVDGSIFHVNQFGTSHTGAIDTSVMADKDLGYDARISSVIESIQSKSNNFVKAFEEKLITRFNHNLKCYVRMSTDPIFISVSSLDDVIELFSLNDPEFDILTKHITYEETVFKCFRSAINSLIGDTTKTGYSAIKDVVYDLPSHPDYVLRENDVFERDPNISDNKKAIEKIQSRFTVLNQRCTVVIANFIPKNLDVDLYAAGNLIIDEVRSIIDLVIFTKVQNENPIFVLKENDKILSFGIGHTIDNERFMFPLL